MKKLYKKGDKLNWIFEFQKKKYFLQPCSSDTCYDCDIRHNDELCHKIKLSNICQREYAHGQWVCLKHISEMDDELYGACESCGSSMRIKSEKKKDKYRAYVKCEECKTRGRDSHWHKDKLYAEAEAVATFLEPEIFDAVAYDDINLVTEKENLKGKTLEEKFSKVFDARNYSSGDGFDNDMPNRVIVSYYMHDGWEMKHTCNILDKNMKELCPKGKYNIIGHTCCGLMVFQPNNSNLQGYMDMDGNEVIPAMYRHCWDFKNGIAQVEEADMGYTWHFINKKNDNLGKDRLLAEASVLNEEYEK